MTAAVALIVSLLAAEPLKIAAGPRGSLADQSARFAVNDVERSGRVTSLQVSEALDARDALAALLADRAALAVTRCDLAHDAYTGRGDGPPAKELRLIAALYPLSVRVLARKSVAASSQSGLKGRKVALPRASADYAQAAALAFAADAVGSADFVAVRLNPAEAAAALEKGEIDAMVMLTPPTWKLDEAAEKNATPERALFSKLGSLGVKELKIDAPDAAAALAQAPCFHLQDGVLITSVVVVGKATLPASVAHEVLANASSQFTLAQAVSATPLPFHPGSLEVLESKGALPFPLKVYVGAYAYSLSGLDLSSGTYLFDGYLWFRWQGPHLGEQPFEFTLVNGTVDSIEDSPVITMGDWHRQSRRISAHLRANFQLQDYPFDHQTLPLMLEHRWMGDARLVFVPDDGAAPDGRALKEAFLSNDVQVQDWVVQSVTHRVETKKYETDFGSIQKGVWAGTSSRYVLTVAIARVLMPYLIKFVLPLLIIVLMAFSVFFINVNEFGVQSAIVITALLSCVAFHMGEANSLPAVGYLVKADSFFMLSYAVIFLTLVKVVAENRLHHLGRKIEAQKVNRLFAVAVPALFLATGVWLVVAH